MLDPLTLLTIALIFFIASLVKGIIGFAMPLIALALLTIFIGLHEGMALLIVPGIVLNLWQALAGGYFKNLLARLWPFYLSIPPTVWLGGELLTRVDTVLLSACLGVLLVFYAGHSFFNKTWTISAPQEKWLAVPCGLISGALTGIIGTCVVPGVLFIQSIKVSSRDERVQALGLLFITVIAALGITLQRHNIITPELWLVSAGTLPPSLIGIYLGRKLRNHLSEAMFRNLILIALFLLGINLIVRAF